MTGCLSSLNASKLKILSSSKSLVSLTSPDSMFLHSLSSGRAVFLGMVSLYRSADMFQPLNKHKKFQSSVYNFSRFFILILTIYEKYILSGFYSVLFNLKWLWLVHWYILYNRSLTKALLIAHCLFHRKKPTNFSQPSGWFRSVTFSLSNFFTGAASSAMVLVHTNRRALFWIEENRVRNKPRGGFSTFDWRDLQRNRICD